MTSPSHIEFEKEFSEKLTVHKNLGQEVVITTVDKVRLCLIKNRECLTAKKEWLTPLSILLTLVTTLIAADFRKFIFEPNVWSAIYILGSLGSFIWLCKAIYSAWKNREQGSIDKIVDELKTQSSEQSQSSL